MEKKRCTKCNIIQDTSKFGKSVGRSRDGLKSWCNACYVVASTAYAKANPEVWKRNSKNYREKHREEINKKRRVEYKINPEPKREIDRKYSAAHRQEAIERAKAWYAENKARVAEWGRNYRKKNAERIKAKKAEYSKSHQHERNALEHKREAMKKGNGGTYTKQQFIDLCERYDNKCLMCGKSDVKLTVDHIVPIALGGSNYIENIQPLCLSCNSKKHTTILDLR